MRRYEWTSLGHLAAAPMRRGLRLKSARATERPSSVASTSSGSGKRSSARHPIQAQLWKKEHARDGTAQWVDARVIDDEALARWGLRADNAAGEGA